MSASVTFYQAQATSCAASALATKLDNERDKYLRAEQAWHALASREIEVKAARDLRDAEKAVVTVDEFAQA